MRSLQKSSSCCSGHFMYSTIRPVFLNIFLRYWNLFNQARRIKTPGEIGIIKSEQQQITTVVVWTHVTAETIFTPGRTVEINREPRFVLFSDSRPPATTSKRAPVKTSCRCLSVIFFSFYFFVFVHSHDTHVICMRN